MTKFTVERLEFGSSLGWWRESGTVWAINKQDAINQASATYSFHRSDYGTYWRVFGPEGPPQPAPLRHYEEENVVARGTYKKDGEDVVLLRSWHESMWRIATVKGSKYDKGLRQIRKAIVHQGTEQYIRKVWKKRVNAS